MKNLEFTKELLQELRQSWIDNECQFEYDGGGSEFHELMGQVLFCGDLNNVRKVVIGYIEGNIKGEPYPKQEAEEWLTLNIVEQEIKKIKGE